MWGPTLRGVLFWGALWFVPGDWWSDILGNMGQCAFRVAFVLRALTGRPFLQEFELCIFAKQTSGSVPFYYQDEA